MREDLKGAKLFYRECATNAGTVTILVIIPRRSSPPRVFIQTNAQHCLGDHLMGKKRICRMDASEARISHKALVTNGAKDASAAHDVESQIDYAPGTLDRAIFGCE